MSVIHLYGLFAERLNFNTNIHLCKHIKLSHKVCDVCVCITFYAMTIKGTRLVCQRPYSG